MNIDIKLLHQNAKVPTKANDNDAGWDLYVASSNYDEQYGVRHYDFGIAFDVPKEYVGLVFPRSSIYKTDLTLSNCVGVIDAGYQGSIKANFDQIWREEGSWDVFYEVGDRAAQIVFFKIPDISLNVVDDFKNSSQRADKGFGSSGK